MAAIVSVVAVALGVPTISRRNRRVLARGSKVVLGLLAVVGALNEVGSAAYSYDSTTQAVSVTHVAPPRSDASTAPAAQQRTVAPSARPRSRAAPRSFTTAIALRRAAKAAKAAKADDTPMLAGGARLTSIRALRG
jgi:hypothetical protein